MSYSKEVKSTKFGHLPLSTSGPLTCTLTVGRQPSHQRYTDTCVQGSDLLTSPYYNKGSAFPPDERQGFKLHGLLPPNVQTLESQVERAYEQYNSRQDALAKNTFMTSMKDQNIVLYYKVYGCSDCETSTLIWARKINLADSRSLKRNVQHNLHPYRRRSYSEFLSSLSQARGVLSQYI